MRALGFEVLRLACARVRVFVSCSALGFEVLRLARARVRGFWGSGNAGGPEFDSGSRFLGKFVAPPGATRSHKVPLELPRQFRAQNGWFGLGFPLGLGRPSKLGNFALGQIRVPGFGCHRRFQD